MIVDLDIGNTRIKWRLLSVDKVLLDSGISNDNEQLIALLVACGEGLRRVRVSCVGRQQQLTGLNHWLLENCGISCEVVRVSAQAAGITNGYVDASQLGVDRWLALCGANAMALGPFVVVDAGSALTLDFVGEGGMHRGGYIVPGIRLMADALQRKTARVLFDANHVPMALGPGCDTQEAVSHGILSAQVAFIEHAVDDFYRGALRPLDERQPCVFLTGGDAALIAEYMTLPATIVADLVFQGIEILLP